MLCIIDSDSPCYAAALSVQEINEDTGEAEVVENGEKFLESNLRSSIDTTLTDTFASDYKLFLTGSNMPCPLGKAASFWKYSLIFFPLISFLYSQANISSYLTKV